MVLRSGTERHAKISSKLVSFHGIIPQTLPRIQNRKIISGVYFLFDKDELVYVGCSNDIFKRIIQHEGKKVFDSYSYIELSNEEEIMLCEGVLIDKYIPKYNKDGKAIVNRKRTDNK